MPLKLSQKEILERFSKLPPNLREVIFSEEITDIMLALGKKYKLPIDKVGELATATSSVMLGALHPNEYINTLEKNLGVDRNAARTIAHEVNTLVFAKVREDLKKLHNIKEDEKSKTPETPSAPPPHAAPEEPSKPPKPAPPIQKTPPSPTKEIPFKVVQSKGQPPKEPYTRRDLTPTPPLRQRSSDAGRDKSERDQKEESFGFASADAKDVANKQDKSSDTMPANSKSLANTQDKKPYSLDQLKKDVSSMQKEGGERAHPEKMPSDSPPPFVTQTEKPRPDIAPSPKTEDPKPSSPFEAKIRHGMFRQKPSFTETTKSGSVESTKKEAASPHDPYRESVDPREKTLNINKHITKEGDE